MTRKRPYIYVLITAVLMAEAAVAKRNSPEIDLDYTPTTAIAAPEVSASSDLRSISLVLQVADARDLDDASSLGERTDDDDRDIDLTATSDVIEFIQHSLIEQADEWRVDLGDEGALVLVVSVEEFKILETNQAVGATYEAWTELEVELRDATGAPLWQGGVAGDATRYGRKFSNDNINEVLSDSLAEALGALFNDRDFEGAIAEMAGAEAAAASSR